MFHVTQRLLLRPAWPEDAEVIHAGIAEEAIVRNLARAPWPYGIEDARSFAALPQDRRVPHFLLERPGEGVIGSAGFGRYGGEVEIGYWLARRHWDRGYATEAVRGLIELARLLGHGRLVAGHFVDNPASGAVLRKAGFRTTGRPGQRFSLARGAEVASVEYALDLAAKEPVPLEQAA